MRTHSLPYPAFDVAASMTCVLIAVAPVSAKSGARTKTSVIRAMTIDVRARFAVTRSVF
jgi:hypothetical protein